MFSATEESDIIEELARLGLPTHIIVWHTPRRYSGLSISASNEDAKEFARHCRDAMIALFGTGLDEIGDSEVDLNEPPEWSISLSEIYSRDFVLGFQHGRQRVANPNSKVFIYLFGRDCDGYPWSRVCEFSSMEEAFKEVEADLASADGPTNYKSISQTDYESFCL